MKSRAITIVGSGLSGLSSALSLSRCVRGANIRLVDTMSEDAWKEAKNANAHVGLWSNAIATLNDLEISGLEMAFVEGSSYRSAKGRILAYPSIHLNAPPSSSVRRATILWPTLAFVNERDLREALLESLRASGAQNGNEVCVDFGRSLSSITRDGLYFDGDEHVSGKNAEPTDLLVAADGRNSLVRKLVFPRMAHEDHVLSQWGYSIFRGTCDSTLPSVGMDGFQSWGVGRRFAAVPKPGGGHVWFAAVSDALLAPHMPVSPPPMLVVEPGQKGLPNPALHLSNAERLEVVRGLFEGWHSEVVDLLGDSGGDVAWDPAVASRAVIPNGLSHVPEDGRLTLTRTRTRT